MAFDPKKLDSIMSAKHISAADLARATGMSPAYISLVRSGAKPDTTVSTLQRFAKALGCPITKLVTE